MSQAELLKKTAALLDRLCIPYMLTGSLASSLQGEPRATHDIDVVADIPAKFVDAIVAEFDSPDYYLSRDAIEQAIRQKGMFNLLELHEGDKVDFWLLTDEAFDRARFARRRRISAAGIDLSVSSPEDTILMKLKWGLDTGGSERQFVDALRVYEVQRERLDLAYLEHWAALLGVTDAWRRLVAQARPIE